MDINIVRKQNKVRILKDMKKKKRKPEIVKSKAEN